MEKKKNNPRGNTDGLFVRISREDAFLHRNDEGAHRARQARPQWNKEDVPDAVSIESNEEMMQEEEEGRGGPHDHSAIQYFSSLSLANDLGDVIVGSAKGAWLHEWLIRFDY